MKGSSLKEEGRDRYDVQVPTGFPSTLKTNPQTCCQAVNNSNVQTSFQDTELIHFNFIVGL